MNINDLHAVRNGSGIRRRRAYSPFIHLSHETPLMRMLYTITRPPVEVVSAPKKPIVRAAKKNIAATTTRPGGSMVSYAKERHKP